MLRPPGPRPSAPTRNVSSSPRPQTWCESSPHPRSTFPKRPQGPGARPSKTFLNRWGQPPAVGLVLRPGPRLCRGNGAHYGLEPRADSPTGSCWPSGSAAAAGGPASPRPARGGTGCRAGLTGRAPGRHRLWEPGGRRVSRSVRTRGRRHADLRGGALRGRDVRNYRFALLRTFLLGRALAFCHKI